MATNELTARNQILRTTYIKSDPLDSLSWVVLKDPALDWEQNHYTAEEEKQGLMEALQDDYFEFGKPALLTGRNAQRPNPQLINGTCANFLPFRSRFDLNSPLKKPLQETQSLFWDTTEHGTVGLGDIYNALGQNRDEYSTRMLYCFQPFEPASGPQGQMRWIVMAMSKVMMNIHYVIFLEVQKTLTGHRVKMQYDSDVLSAVQADAVLELYNQILDTMIALPDGTIGHLFDPPSSLDHIWEDLSPQVR
ncbi:hypothetical protein MMC16_006640 [Acarospora aff. strigata]|nr:hypothetical protein [Acarospora aff. strigata]